MLATKFHTHTEQPAISYKHWNIELIVRWVDPTATADVVTQIKISMKYGVPSAVNINCTVLFDRIKLLSGYVASHFCLWVFQQVGRRYTDNETQGL